MITIKEENDNILYHHIDNGASTVKLDDKYKIVKLNNLRYLWLSGQGYVYEVDDTFNFEDNEYGGFGSVRFTGQGTLTDAMDNRIPFTWWVWFDLEGDRDDETKIYLIKSNDPEFYWEVDYKHSDIEDEKCDELMETFEDDILSVIENAILDSASAFGYSIRNY